ncbi:MAG: hypothetical protein WBD31_21825 [Rubripirellula sp.]
MRHLALLFTVFLFCSGCAHHQLRRNFSRQTQTLGDLYEQQTLDNIAAFAANPGSTPSFAVPTSGGTSINHSNSGNFGFGWSPSNFTGATAGGGGSRSLAETWTMRPVSDPERLRMMKCLFQYVTCRPEQNACNDCYAKLDAFFDGDFQACHLPTCFFKLQENRPLSQKCCSKVGESCGKFVVVDEKHFESLSKITLAVLEIATLSDDAFEKRFAEKKETTVDVKETFVAVIDNKPVLLEGTYSIPKTKFIELQRTNLSAEAFNRIEAALTGRVVGLKAQDGQPIPPQPLPLGSGDSAPSVDSSTLDIQSTDGIREGTQRLDISAPAFESLLQLNQIQSANP